MSERVALLCFFFAGASFCFCFRFALPFPFCLLASCFCRESSDGVEPFSALSAAALDIGPESLVVLTPLLA